MKQRLLFLCKGASGQFPVGSTEDAGWKVATVRVNGAKAISFGRPPSDTTGEARKTVYVQRNGIEYDIALLVYDNRQYDTGLGVFDSVVKSLKWTN